MSQRIVIKGRDLDYFRSIVNSANSGDLGELSEVRVFVTDEGRMILGTNGYVSDEFGLLAENICDECGQVKIAT